MIVSSYLWKTYYDYFPGPLLNLSPTPIQSLSPYIHDCFHGPIVEPGPFVLPLDWGYPMEHDVTSGSMLKAFSCPWIYCEGSSGVLAPASDPLLDPAPTVDGPILMQTQWQSLQLQGVSDCSGCLISRRWHFPVLFCISWFSTFFNFVGILPWVLKGIAGMQNYRSLGFFFQCWTVDQQTRV